MLIDWFTVAAQVINVLVLVAILRYFLYDRVVGWMTERQERIDAGFAEAEQREAEAAEEAERLADERRELETARDRRLREVEEEVERQRKEMLEEARAETARLRDEWRRSVSEEQDRFLAEVRLQVAEAVGDVTRAALADLADTDLSHRMLDVFATRLRQLPDDERRELSELCADAGRVTVASAHPLDPEHRERIEAAVRDELGFAGTVAFDRDHELGCGLELRAGGRSVGWNLARYLDRTADRLEELVTGPEDDDDG